MAQQTRENKNYYPPVAFSFRVEFVEGESKVDKSPSNAWGETSFSEVAGLTMEMGIEELSEGGLNTHNHRLPTKAKFGNLILKRGMLRGDSKVYTWVYDAMNGYKFTPLTIFVTLRNPVGDPLRVWKFEKAWPIKFITSDFKATDNAIVVESFELAYSHFTMHNPAQNAKDYASGQTLVDNSKPPVRNDPPFPPSFSPVLPF